MNIPVLAKVSRFKESVNIVEMSLLHELQSPDIAVITVPSGRTKPGKERRKSYTQTRKLIQSKVSLLRI